MSYNIQEQFQRQGYFGIKITPLGANMVLMEEQEEGELQALLLEAKSWLDQWFSQVKPWEPELVDNERLLWVRVYGIPAHAWHVNFFDLICKPYGTFINADDGTTKKNVMDVARLLMRRKGQRVVDDSFEAIVNGVVFPIRIVEDSYGPMRIVLPANDHHEGRVVSDDNSDEEDGLVNTEAAIFMEDQQAHDDEEREFDRESVQSLALIEFENSKGIRIFEDNTVLDGSQAGEEIVETVMPSHNMLLSKEDLFFTNVERIANNDEPPLIRTVFSSTGNMAENRGAFSDSELLGEVGHKKPKSLLKKSVVTEVPKRGANTSTVSKHAPESLKKRSLYLNNNNNNVASKIHHNLVDSNNMGLSKTVISNNTSSNALSGAATIHDKPVTCVRNPIGRVKKPKVAATNSISSAGAVLCCSSIQSSDIRNCNKQILKRRDNDVTSKIWKGAKGLGIGEGADEDECTRRIQNNEKRDEEGRNRRAQQKKVNK
ncbi:unnamed protein product [Trifolium pratense]|uniref:Uncharacterized protein n=1 Tax=Trifolium pratense TaxID=57577 RepID=A0ACB0LX04_TRIPR|nr:unnamed protein product [Trifolium pratense]